MQRLFLHVGLPKSGTTFLQSVLAQNRDVLADEGYVYPFVRPEAMFHAAVALRGQQELWGLDEDLVTPAWGDLLARARAVGGTAVISHEIFAGATVEQIASLGETLDGFEVHVVVTARDLARQATAHWQEEVKNGRPWSFAQFESALFEESESASEELGFWRSQDVVGVAERWGTLVSPERIRLVVAGRRRSAGQRGNGLWELFARAVDLDPAVMANERLDAAAATGNDSLGTVEVALLREVVAAVGERLDRRAYAEVVKRWFAQRELATRRSPRAVAPAELAARLEEVAQDWVSRIERSGWTVYGDPADLLPERVAGPHPDEVSTEAVAALAPGLLADLLVEVARLRGRAQLVAGAVAPASRGGGDAPSGGGRAGGNTPGLQRFRDRWALRGRPDAP